MSLEVELFLFKEKGRLVGISLVSGAEGHSEHFCRVLPQLLHKGEVAMDAGIDVVMFSHPQAGSCSFMVDSSDAKELQHFIYQTGPYEGLVYEIHGETAFTPRLKITLEGNKDVGEQSGPFPSLQ